MKKVFLAFATTIIVAISVKAQSPASVTKADLLSLKTENRTIKEQERNDRITIRKIEGKEISYQAKDEFDRDFQNVSNVQWSRSNYFDEVSFTKDGKEMRAFYGWDSKLVGTTTPKIFKDLPIAAQKDINKHYKGYTIDDVILFDDEESNDQDMVLFNNQFADEDKYFTELSKDSKTIVLEIALNGDVSYFTQVK